MRQGSLRVYHDLSTAHPPSSKHTCILIYDGFVPKQTHIDMLHPQL